MTLTLVSAADTYRRHAGNDVPHLVYFRTDDLLSFVWTGKPEDPIEVEHGGYGEPVIANIATCMDLIPGTLPDLLALFEATCDAWAERRAADD